MIVVGADPRRAGPMTPGRVEVVSEQVQEWERQHKEASEGGRSNRDLVPAGK